jgi:hypothetical protein
MSGIYFDGLGYASAQRRRVVQDRMTIEAQRFAAVHGYMVDRRGGKPHIFRLAAKATVGFYGRRPR